MNAGKEILRFGIRVYRIGDNHAGIRNKPSWKRSSNKCCDALEPIFTRLVKQKLKAIV
jgi:hypothetical protein